MKQVVLVSLISCAALLSGCNEAEDALRAKPETVDVGEFDGCTVKFVNRGYDVLSFYIARCENTVTTTKNFTQQSGKSHIFRRSTVITQEIEKLQAEKAEAETKERALEKLTPVEKQALGIK